MKAQKLSNGAKILIFALIAAVLSVAIIGLSDVFAEPTIEDLVAEHIHEIGTFEPSSYYSSDIGLDDIKLVGWLKTTQISFTYDVWTDTSGDGLIDVEDVYSVEGFEHDMLMGTMLYPVLNIGDDENYYIVYLNDYDAYDGVIVELQVALNNEYGDMKGEDTYWFDRENNLLYLDKILMDEWVEYDNYCPIRMESIRLVKDIKEMTKTVSINTILGPDVEDVDNIQKALYNQEVDYNFYNWASSGLKYQIIDSGHLSYVSTENIEVYVDGNVTDLWVYDELTGTITIGATPYGTMSIIVVINQLNDVSAEQQALQYVQVMNGEAVGQAATLHEVFDGLPNDGYNLYINYIHYETQPVKGMVQRLSEAGGAEIWHKRAGYHDETMDWGINTAKNTIHTLECSDYQNLVPEKNKKTIENTAKIDLIKQGYKGGCDKCDQIILGACTNSFTYAAIREAIADGMTKMALVNGHYQTSTLSAYGSSANSWKGGTGEYSYGSVWYQMALAKNAHDHNNDPTELLKQAVGLAELGMFKETNGVQKDWDVWNKHDGVGDNGTVDLRYLVSDRTTYFLGGKLNEDSGYVLFDAVCARITGTTEAVNLSNSMNNGLSPLTDYVSNVTIVDVVPDDSGTSGTLYLCVWSRTCLDPNKYGPDKHSQRILAFSRVKYTCDGGNGTFVLIKTNEDGEYVPGATYGIYADKACTKEIGRMTTGDAPIESQELDIGTYYLKELGPADGVQVPKGYLLDETVHTIVITGGSNPVEVKVVDMYQNYNFEFVVYDQTTENEADEYKVPVEGIPFDLYAPDGSVYKSYVTDKNGMIKDSIPATGTYYLKQTDTVEHYCMDTELTSDYYCEYIPLWAHPDNSGVDLPNNKKSDGTYQSYVDTIVHYEQRQRIVINSQVQDENLREDTPAVLGGDPDSGSYTAVLNATYKLVAKSKLLLGYHKGKMITIEAGAVLDFSGGTWVVSKEYSTGTYKDHAVATANKEKAYITATSVRVKHNGETLEFALPNGEYEWQLVDVSPGYWDNGATTFIDAQWKRDNCTKKSISITNCPVVQERQKVNINLVVKYYDDASRIYYGGEDDPLFEIGHYGEIIMDNAWTSLVPVRTAKGDKGDKPEWKKYINEKFTKTISSSDEVVSSTSSEVVAVYEYGEMTIIVETKGTVKNAILEIYNICDIVDPVTGEVVEAGTTLGIYKSDENGNISIVSLGTDEFNNDNATSKDSTPIIDAEYPLTVNGSLATGALPNGRYGVSIFIPPDVPDSTPLRAFETESCLYEAVITDMSSWTPEKADQEVLGVDMVTPLALYDTGNIDEQRVPLAPNPDPDEDQDPDLDPYDPNPDDPYDPSKPSDDDDPDPYDPNHPDDPTGDPDDSGDIPLMTIEWIDKHKYDIAYRVVDPDNTVVGSDGSTIIHDFKDLLPTTFAFYMDHELFLEDGFSVSYALSFYYEISKEEYDAATQAQIDSKEYDTYRNESTGAMMYLRRFSTETLSGGDWLYNVIVLNKDSQGYINYHQLYPNETISGAVYDTEWLTEKLAATSNGEYHVVVCVDTVITRVGKSTNYEVVIVNEARNMGILTIKNRNLIPLD